jgi:hypothetical protein
MTEKIEHSKRESKLELDLKARKALLHLLEGEAKMYEKDMPNLNVGDICSGDCLSKRGYSRIGMNRMYLKERRLEGDAYMIFRAIREVENRTITAVPTHPFYELEAIEF